MTKKILSLVLCAAMMLALLAGCGGKKLSGKYSAEVLESGVTYSFDGNKVTVTLKALGNIVHSVEGKYEIEEDQITFTFPSDEKDAEDYTGTNAEKLAGGWHFNYPKFTAARFTELCEAIYANGGFMTIVHPKTGSYVTTENAVDAWFMDQTGIEVFYTGNSTRDGWVTKANYEFWKDLLAAGKKVYATSGNDEHGMPSNKAVSVIYSTERDATAWVNQIRVGNFVAGGVAVRSAVGQTMMGGTTNFEGERLVFAVDEFHSSLYDPTHTYRVDVVSDTGVVFSQELTGEEVFYHAMDADESAAFYYIEIYDVTTDSLLAIGNPIWND